MERQERDENPKQALLRRIIQILGAIMRTRARARASPLERPAQPLSPD